MKGTIKLFRISKNLISRYEKDDLFISYREIRFPKFLIVQELHPLREVTWGHMDRCYLLSYAEIFQTAELIFSEVIVTCKINRELRDYLFLP